MYPDELSETHCRDILLSLLRKCRERIQNIPAGAPAGIISLTKARSARAMCSTLRLRFGLLFVSRAERGTIAK
jgi:hypothetical protein